MSHASPRGHVPQQLENIHPAQMDPRCTTRIRGIFSLHVLLPDIKIKSSPVCGNEIRIGIIALGEKLQALSSPSKACCFSSHGVKVKVGTRQWKTRPYHWQPVPQRHGIPSWQQVFPIQHHTWNSPKINEMTEELKTWRKKPSLLPYSIKKKKKKA